MLNIEKRCSSVEEASGAEDIQKKQKRIRLGNKKNICKKKGTFLLNMP